MRSWLANSLNTIKSWGEFWVRRETIHKNQMEWFKENWQNLSVHSRALDEPSRMSETETATQNKTQSIRWSSEVDIHVCWYEIWTRKRERGRLQWLQMQRIPCLLYWDRFSAGFLATKATESIIEETVSPSTVVISSSKAPLHFFLTQIWSNAMQYRLPFIRNKNECQIYEA